VRGQETAMFVLSGALSRDAISHAYLFSGPRGCGKTTLARLLAKALNCERRGDGIEPCGACPSCVSITGGNNLDVIEIDGASNNGVDEVRELRSHVSLSPFGSRYKVYIIDEVHMLSLAAFNALLKTLEEPPECVVFILATTEPQKVPVTIRSRCHHIPFHRISVPDIVAQLRSICEAENTTAAPEALWEIARLSDGALRDALSILEQAMLLSGKDVSLDAVERLMGGGSRRELERIVTEMGENRGKIFTSVAEMFRRGASPMHVFETFFLIFRDIWSFHTWGTDVFDSLECSEEERSCIEAAAGRISAKHAGRLMEYCVRLISSAKSGLRADVIGGLFCARVEEIFTEAKEAPRVEEAILRPNADISAKAQPFFVKQPSIPAPSLSMPPKVHASCAETEPRTGWLEVLDVLRDNEFSLYCSLLAASVDESGGEIRIRIPEDRRASFGICSGERNLYALGNVLGSFDQFKDRSFSVSCGKESVASRVSLIGERENEQLSTETEAPADPPKIENPFASFARTSPEKNADGTAQTVDAKAEQDAPVFEGLVSEALRWGGGEVVLINRTEQDETEQDGLIEE
jgi:DNA polymerase-3 subunit gamma/tau